MAGREPAANCSNRSKNAAPPSAREDAAASAADAAINAFAGSQPPCKFVLVSGGVISGIGKGLTASSIGVLLKSCGWRVTAIKIDPYLNIDAGTMSPKEHGEVFVLQDGGEVDLDLGNYERFLDTKLTSDSNITTGKVYHDVLERERNGDFLGKTVQVVPHITDCIKKWIRRVATKPVANVDARPEICVIELGGTVGDIESMPFIEALRQLRYEVGESNFFSVFVSLIPTVGSPSEQKTKPTQHGVKNLRSHGLSPHMIVCRSTEPLQPDVKEKLAMFCQVPLNGVIGVQDVSNTYNIPLMLHSQGVMALLVRQLELGWRLPLGLPKWRQMAELADNQSLHKLRIAMVGKYTYNSDAYISVVRALQHATMALGYGLELIMVESSDLEDPNKPIDAKEAIKKLANGKPRRKRKAFLDRRMRIEDDYSSSGSNTPSKERHDNAWEKLRTAEAVLVPGGFGTRGVEGKIEAIKYALKKDLPFLGICLGMQLAVVENARTVFNEPRAHSMEFFEDRPQPPIPAVIDMPEHNTAVKGGSMRLGERVTEILEDDCLAAYLYESRTVRERHRHRFEVNPEYVEEMERLSDMRFVGKDVTGKRMEIMERKGRKFFLGTQYHPEFQSAPGKPSPVFVGFIMATAGLEMTKESIHEKNVAISRLNPWIYLDEQMAQFENTALLA